ncbi:hypothetical protein [Marinobacter halodurans]|nr:hypothetical protein [Marinobacter halodurans]
MTELSTAPELLASTKSLGGWLKRYKHQSISTGTEMIFAIYLPMWPFDPD